MKFLILLAYFKRPKMVLNALRSIANQTYLNWELAFVDDSGPDHREGQNVLINWATENNIPKDKFKYYYIGDSDEIKKVRGYSRFGAYWNTACYSSTADIGLMLCDDDALFINYLENLNNWFNTNSQSYCHSHLNPFDPFSQTPENCPNQPFWTNHHTSIQPSCTVDASQIAWKISDMISAEIKFPEQQTANLDAYIYTQMYTAWGLCPFSGFLGQFKGTYGNALSYRQGRENQYDVIDLS